MRQDRVEDEAPSGRIVFVLSAFGAGGAERVVSVLANRWAERAGDIAIITFDCVEAEPYYCIHPEIKLIQVNVATISSPIWIACLQTAKRVKALRRALQELKPDVVVSFLTKNNVMAVMAARPLRIPVIISERNNPEAQSFNSAWNRARQLTYPHAFGLVTMTEGAQRFFPASMRKRSWVIPNPGYLPPGLVPRRNGQMITAVGRLADQKGFDLLLEAFAQIALRFPEWKLTIWGEGDDRQKLIAARDRLGLCDRIFLPGITDRPAEWIETADIFVLSSRYEGWGNVLLEAMTAGLPVVSFDCDWGPREMITDGVDGLLVPPQDVSRLADAIAKLIEDERLRVAIGRQAARRGADFAPERISALWRAVAQTAIDESRRLCPRHRS